jgi:hypothetical protein
LIVSAAVAAVFAFVSLIVNGEQVTPGGSVEHVTVTIPVNPVGVTATVEVPIPPAVTVALVPEIVKLGCSSRTVILPVENGA